MKEEIVGVSYEGQSIYMSRTKDNKTFTIQKEECFDKWIADPRITTEHKTIGELNRQTLHLRLDQFLDNQEWEY
jgi:hypothetical protein